MRRRADLHHRTLHMGLITVTFDPSLTFNPLLQPLTASLIGPAPQSLVSALVCRLPLVLPLGERERGRDGGGGERGRRGGHKGRERDSEEKGSSTSYYSSSCSSSHLLVEVGGPPGGEDELLEPRLLHPQWCLDVEEDHGAEDIKGGRVEENQREGGGRG